MPHMKHKIRLTILTAFLLVPVLAKAGDGYSRNEVSLSYGQYSIPGLANSFGAALGSAFQPESGIKASIYGVLTTGYFHWFTQGFSLGCENSYALVGLQDPVIRSMSRSQVEKLVEDDRAAMHKAAAELDFTTAARYRDEMWALQQYLKVWKD